MLAWENMQWWNMAKGRNYGRHSRNVLLYFVYRSVSVNIKFICIACYLWTMYSRRQLRKRINTSLWLRNCEDQSPPCVLYWWGAASRICSLSKCWACWLATEWQKPFSTVMGWVRTRTQFVIFRVVDLRLCGTRHQIWGFGLQDSAAIGVSRWTVNTAILSFFPYNITHAITLFQNHITYVYFSFL